MSTRNRARPIIWAQESFAEGQSWFSVRRLDAVSHFPTLEIPDEMAAVIKDIVAR
jgi:hypothetical protein